MSYNFLRGITQHRSPAQWKSCLDSWERRLWQSREAAAARLGRRQSWWKLSAPAIIIILIPWSRYTQRFLDKMLAGWWTLSRWRWRLWLWWSWLLWRLWSWSLRSRWSIRNLDVVQMVPATHGVVEIWKKFHHKGFTIVKVVMVIKIVNLSQIGR